MSGAAVASAAAADQLVAGLVVTIDGAPLDPIASSQISELVIRDSLMLPASLHLRFSDPNALLTDNPLFDVGKLVVVSTGAQDDPVPLPIFTGSIAAVEPEFRRDGIALTLRAYDLGHVLTRSFNSRTFQFQATSDIVRQVAMLAGLVPGTVVPTGAPHEFVQQSNESDWDFIWRLAIAEDFQFVVVNGVFHFRPAGPDPMVPPVPLRFGDNLREFRPRVSIAQQPLNVEVRGQDPRLKMPVTGMATPTVVDSEPIGMPRAAAATRAMPRPAAVTDAPVDNPMQAFTRATAAADRLAETFVEAEGETVGEPLLRAGSRALVSQVGVRFNGTYTVTSTTHRFRAGRGYQTTFEVSGRSPRTLLELARGKTGGDKGWGANLVIGVVTQNVDPEGMGRVRVRYPSLGLLVESAWARIASQGAGMERGMLMMPIPGEEVVIGFEHGDTKRPFVLGSLFNGVDQPGMEMARPDGPFFVLSNTDAVIRAKVMGEFHAGTMTIRADVGLNLITPLLTINGIPIPLPPA